MLSKCFRRGEWGAQPPAVFYSYFRQVQGKIRSRLKAAREFACRQSLWTIQSGGWTTGAQRGHKTCSESGVPAFRGVQSWSCFSIARRLTNTCCTVTVLCKLHPSFPFVPLIKAKWGNPVKHMQCTSQLYTCLCHCSCFKRKRALSLHSGVFPVVTLSCFLHHSFGLLLDLRERMIPWHHNMAGSDVTLEWKPRSSNFGDLNWTEREVCLLLCRLQNICNLFKGNNVNSLLS